MALEPLNESGQEMMKARVSDVFEFPEGFLIHLQSATFARIGISRLVGSYKVQIIV
jgi:hypothetical protein